MREPEPECVDRDAQPVQPQRGLIDHRTGTQQAPVQARAAQTLEVDAVGPIGGFHLRQVYTAAPGWIEVEERRAGQEPADRLLRNGKRVHGGDEPIDERHERFAVSDVSGAIDQRALPFEQIKRYVRAQIAGVD